MHEKTSVLIVIVNFRTAELVVDCLRSLEPERATLPHVKVVVVDNCSDDGSDEKISAAIRQSGWGSWARLVRSKINGGFSFGNNLAIRPAIHSVEPPDFYWLLNPDTRVHPGALRELIEFLRTSPKVGIAGSSLEEAQGHLWPWAFRFPGILSELEAGARWGWVSRCLGPWRVTRRMGDRPQRVDWLPGASMMIRRDVFRDIGLLDEGYFLYFEETDFCLQAKRAGWQCWYVPQSRVLHIAGQSTGVTAHVDRPRRLPRYWFDSRRRYFIKNHGRLYAVITDTVWMLSYAMWRLRRWVLRRPDTDPPRQLFDFFRYSALWRSRIDGGLGGAVDLRKRSASVPLLSPDR